MSKTEVKPKPTANISVLEEPIKQIIKFVDKLPPQYKEKAFEKLLENAIISNLNNTGHTSPGNQHYFKAPIEVKAFLSQFSIPEENIHKYFLIDDQGAIVPKYRIKTKKAARIQIQLACMLALENALHDGEFEFSIKDIKNKCMDHKCYSKGNFMTYFKLKKDLFKSLDDSEHVVLTPKGKEYLADILDELSNET